MIDDCEDLYYISYSIYHRSTGFDLAPINPEMPMNILTSRPRTCTYSFEYSYTLISSRSKGYYLLTIASVANLIIRDETIFSNAPYRISLDVFLLLLDRGLTLSSFDIINRDAI
jgi:hypothetical protein